MGIRPTDFHTTSVFTAAAWRSWSGLSLHRSDAAVGAARLVSTPSPKGLARDRHLTGFPEFGQFCISGFPKSTQASSSPLRLPFRHARVAPSLYAPNRLAPRLGCSLSRIAYLVSDAGH